MRRDERPGAPCPLLEATAGAHNSRRRPCVRRRSRRSSSSNLPPLCLSMGKKKATEAASPPPTMAESAQSKSKQQRAQHAPTILDPSSSSVSASFPYIKVGASEAEPENSSNSSSIRPKQPGHARLASLSSLRPKPDPVRAAAAMSRFHALIRSQTLAAKGLPPSSSVEIDIHAKDAPWRTDDSLLSPIIAEQYLQYEPVVEMTLRYVDEAGSFPTGPASSLSAAQKQTLEFARYISLARFGETEQNAWKIFKRIAKQKRDERVRHTRSSSSKRSLSARDEQRSL